MRKGDKKSGRISLHPLTFEEAVAALLATDMTGYREDRLMEKVTNELRKEGKPIERVAPYTYRWNPDREARP